MDSKRFALALVEEEQDFEDIYEPLIHILRRMTKGDVPNVSDIYASTLKQNFYPTT